MRSAASSSRCPRQPSTLSRRCVGGCGCSLRSPARRLAQWLSLLQFIRVTGNRLLFCFNPFTRLADGSWNSTEASTCPPPPRGRGRLPAARCFWLDCARTHTHGVHLRCASGAYAAGGAHVPGCRGRWLLQPSGRLDVVGWSRSPSFGADRLPASDAGKSATSTARTWPPARSAAETCSSASREAHLLRAPRTRHLLRSGHRLKALAAKYFGSGVSIAGPSMGGTALSWLVDFLKVCGVTPMRALSTARVNCGTGNRTRAALLFVPSVRPGQSQSGACLAGLCIRGWLRCVQLDACALRISATCPTSCKRRAPRRSATPSARGPTPRTSTPAPAQRCAHAAAISANPRS
jgi:hypothetical protein